MARARRRFGTVSLKTSRRSGRKYIEAKYKPPVEAYYKWPGMLPEYYTKRFAEGFETEAEKWLNDAERAIQQGIWKPPEVARNEGLARRVTFAQYATDYVEHRVKRDGEPIEETTREKYRQYLRDHLLPVLGSLPMASITPDDIERWAASMRIGKAGEGAVIKRRVFELLSGIFAEACEKPLDASGQTLLERNPIRIRVPRPDSDREYVDIDMNELKAIHDAMPPRLALTIYLCGQLALRPGEALALQRRDIALDADGQGGTVHITKNAKEVSRDGSKIVIAGKPKTRGSIRDERIPAWLVPVIQAHLDRFVDDRPAALVFTGQRSRTYVKSQTLRNAYYRARRAVPRVDALAPPLYNLRHRALTRTASYTNSIRAVMAQGGHTQVRTAMHYQHLTSDETGRILAGMNAEAESAGLAVRGETGPAHEPSPKDRAGGATNTDDAFSQLATLVTGMEPAARLAVIRGLKPEQRPKLLNRLPPPVQTEITIALLDAANGSTG